MEEGRGSIAFFGTYRPAVPLDIYSAPIKPNNSKEDEQLITDGESYNSNGQVIPPVALKAILRRPKLARFADLKSGMVFVSERTNNLETLHLALRIGDDQPHKPEFHVVSFGDVYDRVFNGVRMEDTPCFAGEYLIYVSTKDPAAQRRQPWTAVYVTHLQTGLTHRLTPPGTADLSPSVSPSGKKIAVASFEYKHGGWTGEIEDLQTDIVVMNADGSNRTLVVSNGGWPTWGSEDILFFHRGVEVVVQVIDKETNIKKRKLVKKWGVFVADISHGFAFQDHRVTPEEIDAMTPAAINETTVAVATIRERIGTSAKRKNVEEHRHIEIFYMTKPQGQCLRITQNINPMADHYNPFVMEDNQRIGYHRCRSADLKSGDVSREFDQLMCPKEDVGLLRVSGVFPTFSSDGKKLAFVDNDFKKVWLADDKRGLRPICTMPSRNAVFCPVWNQNPDKDTLYICRGEAFKFDKQVVIEAIPNVSLYGPDNEPIPQQLTRNGCNSAFPSTNHEGTKLVFRSTRDWVDATPKGKPIFRNLYIMDTDSGDYLNASATRLTDGKWMDTQSEWSPNGEWIVFSSTRDKPEGAPEIDNELDPGYYAVFLLSVKDPSVVVRVIGSREWDVAGHVNHPCFSPDGRSIVFTSDLAAVSADPISMPIFTHSVRPYGDIFSVDIDPDDITKNENIKVVTRITHSRYENATPCWNAFSIQQLIATYKLVKFY